MTPAVEAGSGASRSALDVKVRPHWRSRTMTEADVGHVWSIEQASFSEPWTANAFVDELRTDQSWHRVVVDNEAAVTGFLVGRCYPDEWHVLDLAVAPRARRRGVAAHLLGEFLDGADRAGRLVVLEVRTSNVAAAELYAAQGFTAVGVRREYYGRGGEDAVVMVRQPRRAAGSPAQGVDADGGAPQESEDSGAGRRLLKKDASPAECAGHARDEDAGSANSSAICATEDVVSGRPVGPGGRGFVFQQPARWSPAWEGLLLAIETSCDDSAAAVLSEEGSVLASVVHSQDSIHERYGGVVPEVAGRAHVERLTAVVREALRQADVSVGGLGAVAATVGPGLIGALLVGVQTAKTIAWSHKLPFVPVNHLHGHLAAVWLGDPAAPFPMVTLVASGGHTSLIRVDDPRTFTLLGQTLDDAAGEAFDKGARLLGLGYPGGRELDVLAESGDPKAFSFPVAMRRSARPDFSFSGVKTSLYYLLRDMEQRERTARAADIAASYREAIVTALLEKSLRAALKQRAVTLAVAGGVAANSLLRRRLVAEGQAKGLHVVVPPFAYCTDNAAMIGAAAFSGEVLEYPDYLDVDASASLSLGQWRPASSATLR